MEVDSPNTPLQDEIPEKITTEDNDKSVDELVDEPLDYEDFDEVNKSLESPMKETEQPNEVIELNKEDGECESDGDDLVFVSKDNEMQEEGEYNSEPENDNSEKENVTATDEGKPYEVSDEDPNEVKMERVIIPPNETPWERGLRLARERRELAKQKKVNEKDNLKEKQLHINLADANEVEPIITMNVERKPLEINQKMLKAIQPIAILPDTPKPNEMIAEYYLSELDYQMRPRFIPSKLYTLDPWEVDEWKRELDMLKYEADLEAIKKQISTKRLKTPSPSPVVPKISHHHQHHPGAVRKSPVAAARRHHPHQRNQETHRHNHPHERDRNRKNSSASSSGSSSSDSNSDESSDSSSSTDNEAASNKKKKPTAATKKSESTKKLARKKIQDKADHSSSTNSTDDSSSSDDDSDSSNSSGTDVSSTGAIKKRKSKAFINSVKGKSAIAKPVKLSKKDDHKSLKNKAAKHGDQKDDNKTNEISSDLPVANSRPGVKMKLVSKNKILPVPKSKQASKSTTETTQSSTGIFSSNQSSLFSSAPDILAPSTKESTLKSSLAVAQLEMQHEFLRNYKDKIAIYRSQLHKESSNTASNATLTHNGPAPIKGPITVMNVTTNKNKPTRMSASNRFSNRDDSPPPFQNRNRDGYNNRRDNYNNDNSPQAHNNNQRNFNQRRQHNNRSRSRSPQPMMRGRSRSTSRSRPQRDNYNNRSYNNNNSNYRSSNYNNRSQNQNDSNNNRSQNQNDSYNNRSYNQNDSHNNRSQNQNDSYNNRSQNQNDSYNNRGSRFQNDSSRPRYNNNRGGYNNRRHDDDSYQKDRSYNNNNGSSYYNRRQDDDSYQKDRSFNNNNSGGYNNRRQDDDSYQKDRSFNNNNSGGYNNRRYDDDSYQKDRSFNNNSSYNSNRNRDRSKEASWSKYNDNRGNKSPGFRDLSRSPVDAKKAWDFSEDDSPKKASGVGGGFDKWDADDSANMDTEKSAWPTNWDDNDDLPTNNKAPSPVNSLSNVLANSAESGAGNSLPKEKRREELLKQLKAVEDAIAKKKAKIDK